MTNYYHNEHTGMEYWHDGKTTRSQCHDGVGLVTTHYQIFDDYIAMTEALDALVEDEDGNLIEPSDSNGTPAFGGNT